MEMRHFATLVVFAIIALLFAFRFPERQKLEWMDWKDAYKLAKKKEKLLLIDAYTDWCGWCKKMDADTYSQAEIIQLVKKNFVPVKFNPELNRTYEVNGDELSGRELLSMLSGGGNVGYPTTFFLDLQKNKIQMVSGYKDEEAFKQVLLQKIEWAKSE